MQTVDLAVPREKRVLTLVKCLTVGGVAGEGEILAVRNRTLDMEDIRAVV